jgi:hypothetical protein
MGAATQTVFVAAPSEARIRSVTRRCARKRQDRQESLVPELAAGIIPLGERMAAAWLRLADQKV